MTQISKIASLIFLSLVIFPCLLFFVGVIGLGAVKAAALIGTLGWFATCPLWMGKELGVDASEVEI